MKPLIIAPTDKTPSVTFDADSGVFEIKGRSIPKDAEEFYASTLDWLESYKLKPNEETVVSFNLEFFNISSSKRILFILYKLNEIVEAGHKVNVRWTTLENDDDMFEVGQDYAFMVNIPFEFIQTAKKEKALVA